MIAHSRNPGIDDLYAETFEMYQVPRCDGNAAGQSDAGRHRVTQFDAVRCDTALGIRLRGNQGVRGSRDGGPRIEDLDSIYWKMLTIACRDHSVLCDRNAGNLAIDDVGMVPGAGLARFHL
jgi:hypothetical protein